MVYDGTSTGPTRIGKRAECKSCDCATFGKNFKAIEAFLFEQVCRNLLDILLKCVFTKVETLIGLQL